VMTVVLCARVRACVRVLAHHQEAYGWVNPQEIEIAMRQTRCQCVAILAVVLGVKIANLVTRPPLSPIVVAD
jgi:hypothetical protein